MSSVLFLFFFNDTATTEIYTLSLHDALPISGCLPPAWTTIRAVSWRVPAVATICARPGPMARTVPDRSEEHTSELQSHVNLVCRLLLEKKKKTKKYRSKEEQRQRLTLSTSPC